MEAASSWTQTFGWFLYLYVSGLQGATSTAANRITSGVDGLFGGAALGLARRPQKRVGDEQTLPLKMEADIRAGLPSHDRSVAAKRPRVLRVGVLRAVGRGYAAAAAPASSF